MVSKTAKRHRARFYHLYIITYLYEKRNSYPVIFLNFFRVFCKIFGGNKKNPTYQNFSAKFSVFRLTCTRKMSYNTKNKKIFNQRGLYGYGRKKSSNNGKARFALQNARFYLPW